MHHAPRTDRLNRTPPAALGVEGATAVDGAPELRPYQREAVAAVVAARKRGVRRQLVCLPTGAGKTVIFSRLAAMARRPVLVLAHRAELLEQAREKLERALAGSGPPPPSGWVGVEQGARRAPADVKVVVASIRSLRASRLARLLAARAFGLVIYDECHHAPAEDNARVLRELGAFEPEWSGTLLGFTATTTRGDGVGLGKVFEEVVYRRSLPQMIGDGYLAPLRGFRVATAADLTALTGRAQGDFEVEALAEAVDIEERNALVARSIQELARDRRTIVFCVTVAHARRLARALRHVGVPAAEVHGEMDPERRARTLAEFRAGRLHAVTNVAVLTEGFDDPGVSCVAMARPTRSDGMYAQCVGRGTRLHPGKRDCLVLDFVDLSRLSLVTLPSLFGLPRDLNLEGRPVDEAAQALYALEEQHPGFEVEPGEITLAEIQERAACFDPLTLSVDPEVAAISGNAWVSLGSAGLALHVQRGGRGRSSEFLVLRAGARGARYDVRLDERSMARFTSIEEAVEAVDYEVQRLGRQAAASARPEAPWRRAPVPEPLVRQLAALRPPRRARDHGDALRLLAYARHQGGGLTRAASSAVGGVGRGGGKPRARSRASRGGS